MKKWSTPSTHLVYEKIFFRTHKRRIVTLNLYVETAAYIMHIMYGHQKTYAVHIMYGHHKTYAVPGHIMYDRIYFNPCVQFSALKNITQEKYSVWQKSLEKSYVIRKAYFIHTL